MDFRDRGEEIIFIANLIVSEFRIEFNFVFTVFCQSLPLAEINEKVWSEWQIILFSQSPRRGG